MATTSGRTQALDSGYLLVTAIATVAMQLSFFAVAATCKFDKVTDFAGGSNFVLLAVLTLLLGGTYHIRQIVVTALVLAWGVRIAGFLLYRVIKTGKDDRFDGIRESFFKFLCFWVFQIFWVWLVSLPVTLLNAYGARDPPLAAADYAGWAMCVVGLVIETVADAQKTAFKNDARNRGKFCGTGLWSWSRHPNYFGEMLFWWGIYTAASPVFGGGYAPSWYHFSVIGPLYTMLILLFLSGLPTTEKSSDERYGSYPEYVEYRRSTSILVPCPPFIYRSLAPCLKALFCFEWPMYSHLPPRQHDDATA